MMIDDETGVKSDGFKLRMSQGKWFLFLWFEGKDTGASYGPFTYNEAKAWIAEHSHCLNDLDKVDFAVMNKKQEELEAWEKAKKRGG